MCSKVGMELACGAGRRSSSSRAVLLVPTAPLPRPNLKRSKPPGRPSSGDWSFGRSLSARPALRHIGLPTSIIFLLDLRNCQDKSLNSTNGNPNLPLLRDRGSNRVYGKKLTLSDFRGPWRKTLKRHQIALRRPPSTSDPSYRPATICLFGRREPQTARPRACGPGQAPAGSGASPVPGLAPPGRRPAGAGCLRCPVPRV